MSTKTKLTVLFLSFVLFLGCKEEEIGNNFKFTGFIKQKTSDNYLKNDHSGITVLTNHGDQAITNAEGKFTFSHIPSGKTRLEIISPNHEYPVYARIWGYGSGEQVREYEIFDQQNIHLAPNSISLVPTDNGIKITMRNDFLDENDSSVNYQISIQTFVSSSPDVSYANYEYVLSSSNYTMNSFGQTIYIPEEDQIGTKYVICYTSANSEAVNAFFNKDLDNYIKSSYQPITDLLEVDF